MRNLFNKINYLVITLRTEVGYKFNKKSYRLEFTDAPVGKQH